MAFLTITRIDGDSAELLETYQQSAQTMSNVGRDHGLLVHATATTDTGLVMINLWQCHHDSEAAAIDPRRIRALRESGLRPEQIHREHHEVANHVVFARKDARDQLSRAATGRDT